MPDSTPFHTVEVRHSPIEGLDLFALRTAGIVQWRWRWRRVPTHMCHILGISPSPAGLHC